MLYGLRFFLLPLSVSCLLTACSSAPERSTPEQIARAFYERNHAIDPKAFAGLTIVRERTIVQGTTARLGHVYSIQFCTEVVDVSGQRAASGPTYYYSDWPATQQRLVQAGLDSARQRQLATMFELPAAKAPAAFAEWAGELITRLNALRVPAAGGQPAREVRECHACFSADGQAVVFKLTGGVDVLYLAPDTEPSLYWTREKRRLHPLATNWWWRPAATAAVVTSANQ